MENDKKTARNIKDVREFLGLTQEELGNLMGVTGVYISQIEKNKRPLTLELAEKLLETLLRLYYENPQAVEEYMKKENTVYRNANKILWYHIASFYPEKEQKELLTLLNQKLAIETAITSIIEDWNIKGMKWVDEIADYAAEAMSEPTIYSIIRGKINIIHERINFLREAGAFKKPKGYIEHRY